MTWNVGFLNIILCLLETPVFTTGGSKSVRPVSHKSPFYCKVASNILFFATKSEPLLLTRSFHFWWNYKFFSWSPESSTSRSPGRVPVNVSGTEPFWAWVPSPLVRRQESPSVTWTQSSNLPLRSTFICGPCWALSAREQAFYRQAFIV